MPRHPRPTLFPYTTLFRSNVQNDPDNWTVRVTNPDGTASNTFGFTVVAPTPIITSLTTNPSPPTTATFTFTIERAHVYTPVTFRLVTAPSAGNYKIPNGAL